MFIDLGALQHARKRAFRVGVQGFDPLGQIILCGKVVFVDLLKELVLGRKRHACDIPVKVLRQHGRDSEFSD